MLRYSMFCDFIRNILGHGDIAVNLKKLSTLDDCNRA